VTRAPERDLADDWCRAAGWIVLSTYVTLALVVDWRPADVLHPWLPVWSEISLNLLTLLAAWRTARRIGARYGRRRAAAAGLVPGTLPTTVRKDTHRV
jgi:hypothetical protein